MEDGEGTQHHGLDQSQNLTVSPGGETGQEPGAHGLDPTNDFPDRRGEDPHSSLTTERT